MDIPLWIAVEGNKLICKYCRDLGCHCIIRKEKPRRALHNPSFFNGGNAPSVMNLMNTTVKRSSGNRRVNNSASMFVGSLVDIWMFEKARTS